MTAGDMHSEPASDRSAPRLRGLLLPFAGVIATLLALPVVLFFNLPLAGWIIGAGLVLVNSLAHSTIAWLVRDASITVTLGAMGFSMMARAGITALILFFVGAQIGGVGGDRAFGLDRPDLAKVAIVVFLIGFTLDAFIDTLRRASERDALTPATPVQETSA